MKGWSYWWCWTVTELRRVTGLMRRSTGRLSGHKAELREESGHRRKRERSRLLKEETKCEGSHRWMEGMLGSRQRSTTVMSELYKSQNVIPENRQIEILKATDGWYCWLSALLTEHHCFLYSYCSLQIVSSCSSFLWKIDEDPQYCTWLAPKTAAKEPNMSLRRW